MSRSSRAGRFRWHVLAESSADWERRGSPEDDGYGLFFASSIVRNGANAQLWLRCFNEDANRIFVDEQLAKRASREHGNKHLTLYSFPDSYRHMHPFGNTFCYALHFSAMQKSMRDSFVLVKATPSLVFPFRKRRSKPSEATKNRAASSICPADASQATNRKHSRRRAHTQPEAVAHLLPIKENDRENSFATRTSLEVDAPSATTLNDVAKPNGKDHDNADPGALVSAAAAPESPSPSPSLPNLFIDDASPSKSSTLISVTSPLPSTLSLTWRKSFERAADLDSGQKHEDEKGVEENAQDSEYNRQWRLWQRKYAELEKRKKEAEDYKLCMEEERAHRRRRQIEGMAQKRAENRLRIEQEEKCRQEEEQTRYAKEIEDRRRTARERRENMVPVVDLLEQSVAMAELESVVFSRTSDVAVFLSESDTAAPVSGPLDPLQRLGEESLTGPVAEPSVCNPWTYRNNSCCIDVVLMFALAAGGDSNVLRRELLFEDKRYAKLADLAPLEKRTLLRKALQHEHFAIRQSGEHRSCDTVRDRLADCAGDDERRHVISDGEFQDAQEVLDILLTALIGQRHVVCEELCTVGPKPTARTDGDVDEPIFERRSINVCSVFQTRALLRKEETESRNSNVLQAYDGEKLGRQSLQRLLNRDNDFVPSVRRSDSRGKLFVRRALVQHVSPGANSKPFDYVFVYLNRRREKSVIYVPVVFQRIIVLPSVRQECPVSSDTPCLASPAAHSERFVLAGVASFYKSHWTMAFRGDSPSSQEQFSPLDENDYCGDGPARWMYYDDLQHQQTGDNALQPIGNTYRDLLTWSPDARSVDFFQKTGSLFLYIRPNKDSET